MSQMDGCIATWIVLMELHFEEENISKEQECSALAIHLEDMTLNFVIAKRSNEPDSACKIFDILLNRFGSGVQGHQRRVKFEKSRQRDDDSFDKFLDDHELLRTRSNPDGRTLKRNIAMDSKLMEGVKKRETGKSVVYLLYVFSGLNAQAL